MTGHDRMVRWAVELVREGRTVMQEPEVDLARMVDIATCLDELADQVDTGTQDWRQVVTDCEETAAWCRLAAGLLRGEDVPESIHVPAGENRADTARWEKWRVS
jgi:hypothetical protein